jgi:hypothetical protein
MTNRTAPKGILEIVSLCRKDEEEKLVMAVAVIS